MNSQKCVDKEGHNYEFVGYMVVAQKLPKTGPSTPPIPSSLYPSTIPGRGTWPLIEVPSYCAAKIEVHQCKKCGWIILRPAVFSRILSEDKKKE